MVLPAPFGAPWARQRPPGLGLLSVAALLSLTLAGCRRKHVAPAVPEPPAPVAAAPAEPAPVAAEPVVAAPASPPSAPAAAPAEVTYEKVTPADGGTINGAADGPKAEEMNKILKAALPKLEACLAAEKGIELGKPLKIDVQYKVGNDGKPTDVEVKGAPGASQACLAQQVAAIVYPAFGGPPLQHSFPINYQRSAFAPAAPK